MQILCSFTGNVLSTDPASGMIHIYDDCISIFFILWFRSGPHFYWDVLFMHLSFYNSREFLSWCFVFCPETLESQHMQNIIIIILLSLEILCSSSSYTIRNYLLWVAIGRSLTDRVDGAEIPFFFLCVYWTKIKRDVRGAWQVMLW